MIHQRTKIRHAVADLMVGHTDAGDRVFRTRVLPARRLKLPSISVYTLSESVNPDGRLTAPREDTRILDLTIEAWVRSSTSKYDEPVDDIMDSISLQIERSVMVDPQLGGIASDLYLRSTDTEVVEIGDRMMGLVVMTFGVEYCALASVYPGVIGDFVTADAITNLSGSQNITDRTEDRVSVQ